LENGRRRPRRRDAGHPRGLCRPTLQRRRVPGLAQGSERAARRRGGGRAGRAPRLGRRGRRRRRLARSHRLRHHLHSRRYGERRRASPGHSPTPGRKSMKKLFVIAAIIAAAFAAYAQKFDLTIDNIMRGPGLVGYEPEDVRWAPDGAKAYFSWKQVSEPLEKERDTYVVKRDGSGVRKLSDEEKKDAPPSRGDRTRDKRRVVYAEDGDIFLWDGKRHALTQTTDGESSP